MPTFTQILASVVIGIVSLGLLVFILRQIFLQLNNKVDKNVFEEHCKRIDGVLREGTSKFVDIQASMKENTQQTYNLCGEVIKLQGNIDVLVNKMENWAQHIEKREKKHE